MICNNCGSQIPDGQMICNVCGGYVNSSSNMNQGYGQPMNQGYGQPMNQSYGQPMNQSYGQPMNQGYGQPMNQDYGNYMGQNNRMSTGLKGFAAAEAQGLGMKWFKFIIYVQLFLNAVLNFIMGIACINGSQYDIDSEKVYAVFEKLETADKLYGFCLIGLAVFAIVVRIQLAGFKKNSDVLYLIMLAANLIVALIYFVIAKGIIDADVNPNYANIVTSLCLIVANVTYFKNRKHLFIN